MTQSLPYHGLLPPDYGDLLAAGVPPADAEFILENFELTTFTPIPCGDGDYAYFANPPGCGADHFRAVIEVLRSRREGDAVRPLRQEPARSVMLCPYAEPAGTRHLPEIPQVRAPRAKPPRQHKPRRPSIKTMIEQAEKAGKPLASITLADGTKLDFGQPEPVEPDNSWPLDEFRTKEIKQ